MMITWVWCFQCAKKIQMFQKWFWCCCLFKEWTATCSTTVGTLATLVGGHGVPDPSVVVADLGVHTGLVLHSAAITPGHNTLQSTVADNWATGVTLNQPRGWKISKRILKFKLSTCVCTAAMWYLAGVLATLKESSAEHVGCDLTGVGVPARAVTQDGCIQTHQTVGVVAWGRGRKMRTAY